MTLVRDIMSRNVATLKRNDRLSEVGDLMKVDRIRHMPILDDRGGLAGVVSQRDLFLSGLVRALGFGTSATEKVLDSLRVKEVMTKDVITTTPDTPLPEAAKVMCENKIGCLPVIDGDDLVGILTEGDFVAAATAIRLAEVVARADGDQLGDLPSCSGKGPSGGRRTDQRPRHSVRQLSSRLSQQFAGSPASMSRKRNCPSVGEPRSRSRHEGRERKDKH